MKRRIVINDLHLGVQRSGGTTGESAAALRQYALDRYAELLVYGDHFVVNGDMFDTFQIPLTDLLGVYEVTSSWLESDRTRTLDLIPGNHDLSKNSANMSSFELMARLLRARYPDQVRYLAGGNWIDEGMGIYAVSHVANQDLFDLELKRVPESAKTLLLHCNFDNKFAGQSDHSLNLDREQAKVFTKRGTMLVLGHEHHGRVLMNDKVIITGNQFPTSVSDCLPQAGQNDHDKRCLVIEADGDLDFIPTWAPGYDLGYRQVDWKDLDTDLSGLGFIRVSGEATAAEASSVIKSISALRQKSKAFVITNAVKVEGSGTDESFAESVEDIRGVDVLSMLIETLDTEQAACVRKLLKEAA